MHVVMVSDNETVGGAAAAASRLADTLVADGVRVTRLVARPDRRTHPWTTIPLTASDTLARRLLRKALPLAAEAADDRHAVRELDNHLAALKPDVINLHNIHSIGFILHAHFSAAAVAVCLRHAPVAWTLHDQWSYTGRCGYAFDCRKFLTGCDAACPTPNEYPALAPHRIHAAWAEKKALLAPNPRLAAVTPSRWMADEARAGSWAGNRVEVIPYGIPLDVYQPIDRALARTALNLPAGEPVLMAVAEDLAERRKGGRLLTEALANTRHRPVTLVTLGKSPMRVDSPGVNSVHLGYLDNDRLKALVYSAADIFVHPAIADNLPLVLQEALACGVPGVGFPVTGVPEMVVPGRTGWLAAEPTAAALTAALDTAIAEMRTAGPDWHHRCRAFAEEEYAPDRQVKRYRALFADLIGK